VGQQVKREDVIAITGSTGISTGPHVHYEIWKNGHHVNPMTYLERK
jgi:murein DD-endopeptidase